MPSQNYPIIQLDLKQNLRAFIVRFDLGGSQIGQVI